MAETGPVEQSIRRSIEKSGFPEKAVRLPFKPVYDACRKYQTPLAQVLEHLESEDILSKVDGNHIVFYASSREFPEAAEETAGPGPDPALWSALADAGGPGNVPESMASAVAGLSPEQLDEIQKAIAGMSEEDRNRLIEMVAGMMPPPGTQG